MLIKLSHILATFFCLSNCLSVKTYIMVNTSIQAEHLIVKSEACGIHYTVMYVYKDFIESNEMRKSKKGKIIFTSSKC